MRRPAARVATPALRAGVTVLVLDQLTKSLLSADRVAPTAAVVPLRNDEAMLGLLGGGPLVLCTLMAGLLLAFGFHVVGLVRQGRLSPSVAGLLVGGAAGNLADRALSGSVRDFIRIGDVVLNVADIAIVVGLGAYAVARTRREVTTCPPSAVSHA